MKFHLVDNILELSPERIVATKQVSLAEEYLADHFPTFPVLPGVMMLEALTQSAGWLLHHRTDFACAFAVLKEARNVRYGHFVAPGHHLIMEVSLTRPSPGGATFRALGTVDGVQAVSAKLELAYFNLADRQPGLAAVDGQLKEHHRRRWSVLQWARRSDATGPQAGVSLA